MQDNMEKPDAIEVLKQEKAKAAKQAEKKLFLASKGQTGFIPGKERNSLRDQLGIRTPVAPLVSSKIGRNAKCPCNSGKKFKNCCGR